MHTVRCLCAVAAAGLVVAGCATSRDLRLLQVQLDQIQAEQRQLVSDVSRLDSLANEQGSDTRAMVVDLKASVADIDDRLMQMDAQLADIDLRVSGAVAAAAVPVVISGGGATAVPADSGLSDNVQEIYQQAFEALNRDDHQAAIAGFRTFIDLAPEAPEAASAAYWLGESFYALGENDSALARFQAVLDRYPESEKVPAALLKTGNIYTDRGDKTAAYPYYRRLKEEFPQSLEYQLLRRKLEE
jgi:tol-pal system protein YbgF